MQSIHYDTINYLEFINFTLKIQVMHRKYNIIYPFKAALSVTQMKAYIGSCFVDRHTHMPIITPQSRPAGDIVGSMVCPQTVTGRWTI